MLHLVEGPGYEVLQMPASQSNKAHLHRTPGLSEHFIYQNDDFFACPLAAAHVFGNASRAGGAGQYTFKAFASRSPMQYQRSSKNPGLWGYSLHNARRAFAAHAPRGAPFPFLFWHGAYFLTRAAYVRAWDLFREELHRVGTFKHRFYAVNVQPVALVLNLAVAEGMQALDASFSFQGFGPSNTLAFSAVAGAGLTGLCKLQPRVLTAYHQALAKIPSALALKFCRATVAQMATSFAPAARECVCAGLPFASRC